MTTKDLRQNYNATVTFAKQVTEALLILRVKPDAGHEIKTFLPGQYSTLGLISSEKGRGPCDRSDDTLENARFIKRAYSISHAMADTNGQKLQKLASALIDPKTGEIEFYIALVTNTGDDKLPALTPRLFNLKTGDRLFIGPPKGHYLLDEEDIKAQKHFIFCSTGTGLAPHNAFVFQLLQQHYTAPITVITCSTLSDTHAYEEEYRALTQQYSNLKYISLVTREKNQPKRYIQNLFENQMQLLQSEYQIPVKKESAVIYLCGNPAMIGAWKEDPITKAKIYPPGTSGMIEILEKQGMQLNSKKEPHGQIHFEKYW
jgi:ferredoxin--NADP+ reductase